MDEDQKERVDEILDDLNRDIEMPPYDTNSGESRFSRKYQKYKEDDSEAKKTSKYENLCYQASSVLNLNADGKTKDKLDPAIKLLGWEITPGMVLSAAVGVFSITFAFWILGVILNEALGAILQLESGIIPFSLMMIFGLVPFMLGVYAFYRPIFEAKSKVIESSGEMILAILYMVVYMRSNPSLEGAVRFAALNLEGPISKDLKGVLWSVEVGEYKRIDAALENYTSRWRDYNKDFLESLNLLRAATNEPNPKRRESLLQDAIDNILDGTQEKMKHYAQSLETPVMILNAVGALLPVLGMIMLPLISTFLGGVITPLHLFIIFNLLLPTFLWVFMQQTLSSRPPTVDTAPVHEDSLPARGRYQFEVMGSEFDIPVWPIGVLIALIFGLYGIIGYLSFPHLYPISDSDIISSAPLMFTSEEGELSPFSMLLRSLSIIFGIGLGIGVTKILGNYKRQREEKKLEEIESEFPTALFELGNKISGGTPIELALDEAADSTQDLKISELFEVSSNNINNLGMTFKQSIFDPKYGSLSQFPSQMIKTVMKAILESSEKGTNIASNAMLTISRYLKSIHKTQEQLKDLMQDTTTTIQMLAYMLAPIVSGVAVGMSQTIITGLFELSGAFEQGAGAGPEGSQGAEAAGTGVGGGTMLENLDSAIPPELLQLVVGVYLIQLLYILGTFYMKITRGEDQTYKNMFIGKIMISGIFFYTMTVVIVSLLFGGMMSGVGDI